MSQSNFAAALETGVMANPFPGLRSFEFEESHLFFGRDGQSEQLITKLGRTHFVAVVGTSGSGKSSLVRAGLLPALLGGFMAGVHSEWRIAVMRPGNDPIGNLARSLNAPVSAVESSDGDLSVHTAGMEATLRRGSRGLVDVFRHLRQGNESLLLVVDQFEEIFRLARGSAGEAYQNQAAAFVKLFLEASQQRDLPIYVVLTMRSDYLGDCSQFWGLPEAVNESQYLIPRLTRDQLREAITGPVAVGGGAITARLVNRLLNDVGDNQDQLPILQHALMRTWTKWKETPAQASIDLQDYEAIGGMASALSLHADEAFNDLPDQRSREIVEKLFKALTEKGPDNREIRRPITIAEASAVTGATEAEIKGITEIFRQPGRSFLMPPADVPLSSESLLDISHESLIRGWQRLKAWAEEEGESARIYRRLAQTAELHQRGQAGLWGDPDLQLALDWREKNKPNEHWARRYHPDFASAMQFLEQSRQQRDREVLGKQRQQRKMRLLTIAFLAISILALLVPAYLIWQSRKIQKTADEEKMRAQMLLARANRAIKDADEHATTVEASANAKISAEEARVRAEQDVAEANQKQTLALRIAAQANDQPDLFLSGVLAIESLETSDTPQGRRALATAFRLSPPAPEIINTGSLEPFTAIAFSPDNTRMAGGTPSGQVVIWDLANQRRERVFETNQMLLTLAFSANARWLAAGTTGALWLWDAETGNQLQDPIRDLGNIKSIAFSPNGEYLAIVGGLHLGLFQSASGHWKEIKVPTKSELPVVESVVFLDNSAVAIAGSHGISFMKIPSFDLIISTRLEGICRSVALSHDYHWLAAACDDHEILWTDFTEQDSGGFAYSRVPINTFSPNLIAISSNGKYIAAKDYSRGAIHVYDSTSRQEILQEPLPVFSGIPSSSFVFRSDSQTLTATLQQYYGSIAQWNLTRGARGAIAHRWPSNIVISGMTFSPDKESLAITSPDDGMVRIIRASDIQNPFPAHTWQIGSGVRKPVFSADGHNLAVIDDREVCLIQMKPWKELGRFPAGKDTQAAFSRDSRLLLLFDSGQIRPFKIGNLTELMPAINEELPKYSILASGEYKLSPSGNLLAATIRLRFLNSHVSEKVIRVWNLDTGLELARSKIPQQEDASDGPWNSQEGQRLLGDSAQWQSIFEPTLERTNGRWSTKPSPGSSTLDLIDTGTKQTVNLLEHDGRVLEAAFSPDGRWLLTSSGDKTVRLWPLQVEDLIKQACTLLPRNLTEQEWKGLNLEHPYHKTCPKLP